MVAATSSTVLGRVGTTLSNAKKRVLTTSLWLSRTMDGAVATTAIVVHHPGIQKSLIINVTKVVQAKEVDGGMLSMTPIYAPDAVETEDVPLVDDDT